MSLYDSITSILSSASSTIFGEETLESDELDKIITPETFKKTQKLIIEKVVLASVPNIQGNAIIQDNVVKRKFVPLPLQIKPSQHEIYNKLFKNEIQNKIFTDEKVDLLHTVAYSSGFTYFIVDPILLYYYKLHKVQRYRRMFDLRGRGASKIAGLAIPCPTCKSNEYVRFKEWGHTSRGPFKIITTNGIAFAIYRIYKCQNVHCSLFNYGYWTINYGCLG